MSEREGLVQLTTPAELEQLRPLWVALHSHHQAVTDFPGFVADDETSWQPRKAHSTQLLEADLAAVLLATDSGGVAGCAFVRHQ